MAIPHSKDSYLAIEDIGGVSRDLSAFVTAIDGTFTTETAETQGMGGTAHKTRIAGQRDSKVTLTLRWDPTATTGPATVLAALAFNGGVKTSLVAPTVIYGPSGSTGTMVKYTGTAIVTSFKPGSKLGSAVEFTCDLEAAAAWTATTF